MDSTYKILDWDSQFFGYRIAAIKAVGLRPEELGNILKNANNHHVELVYCFANPSDDISNTSINNAKGLLVDEKITFFRSISDTENFTESIFIQPYNHIYPSEKLKSLALQSGIYSRFKVDPNFKNKEFENLYLEWIKKSVQKKIAEEVLVYIEDNDEKGLITLGLEEEIGSIGLLAVDEKERGKSIGRKLVQSALLYFQEKKANIVEVVTQVENKGACGFYKNIGFDVKNIVNIYHLWIS